MIESRRTELRYFAFLLLSPIFLSCESIGGPEKGRHICREATRRPVDSACLARDKVGEYQRRVQTTVRQFTQHHSGPPTSVTEVVQFDEVGEVESVCPSLEAFSKENTPPSPRQVGAQMVQEALAGKRSRRNEDLNLLTPPASLPRTPVCMRGARLEFELSLKEKMSADPSLAEWRKALRTERKRACSALYDRRSWTKRCRTGGLEVFTSKDWESLYFTHDELVKPRYPRDPGMRAAQSCIDHSEGPKKISACLEKKGWIRLDLSP